MSRSLSKKKAARKPTPVQEEPLPDGGWKKTKKVMGFQMWEISGRDMDVIFARVAKKLCAKGDHFYAPPHHPRGRQCFCPQSCIHCGKPEPPPKRRIRRLVRKLVRRK